MIVEDGSVSEKTAWMDKPYLGDEEEYGMPVCSDELIESAIKVSKEKGCQISMHAMGEEPSTELWIEFTEKISGPRETFRTCASST